jgi:hypothetical protein
MQAVEQAVGDVLNRVKNLVEDTLDLIHDWWSDGLAHTVDFLMKGHVLGPRIGPSTGSPSTSESTESNTLLLRLTIFLRIDSSWSVQS